MPKQVYCAKCGTELLMQLKAVPAEGKVIAVVEPHTCDEKTVTEIVEINEDIVEVRDQTVDELVNEADELVKGVDLDSKPLTTMVENLDKKAKVAALFDDFPFVKKLNADVKEHEVPEVPGDQRDKKHLREELQTSSAPQSILNRAQNEAGKTTPEHEMEEPEDEQA